MLLGSILTVSAQLCCPKQIVQCSTSQLGSTFLQVSHIRPNARMSVQAWQNLLETFSGLGSPTSSEAISLLICRTSAADARSTASPRTWCLYLLTAACVTPSRSATSSCFIPYSSMSSRAIIARNAGITDFAATSQGMINKRPPKRYSWNLFKHDLRHIFFRVNDPNLDSETRSKLPP